MLLTRFGRAWDVSRTPADSLLLACWQSVASWRVESGAPLDVQLADRLSPVTLAKCETLRTPPVEIPYGTLYTCS